MFLPLRSTELFQLSRKFLYVYITQAIQAIQTLGFHSKGKWLIESIVLGILPVTKTVTQYYLVKTFTTQRSHWTHDLLSTRAWLGKTKWLFNGVKNGWDWKLKEIRQKRYHHWGWEDGHWGCASYLEIIYCRGLWWMKHRGDGGEKGGREDKREKY